VKAGSSLPVAIAVVLALGGAASAQPSAQTAAATAQFDKGRALMKQKKYEEACAAFESSQKLDPQWGTLYNLATCYTATGKLASAWAAYRELAQRDTNAPRRKDSAKRAKALDKRLPRLLVKVPAAPPDLAVTLDGADITSAVDTETPIDLGPHKLHASAPRHKDFDATTTIRDEGKTVVVSIELAPAPVEPTTPVAERHGKRATSNAPPVAERAADRPGDDRREPSRRGTYGVIAAVGGVALVGTGLIFGRLASDKWSQAKALCGDDLACDNSADLMTGNALVADARSQATISTALVIGGAAAIGLGAVLYLTAPSDGPRRETAWRVVPSAGPGSVAVTLGGRF